MIQYGLNAYASDFVIDEENIWFVPFGYNYLCCYSLQSNVIEKRIKLPVENNRAVLYAGMAKLGNRIILIPFEADAVIVYDITDGEIISILIGEAENQDIYRAYCIENDNVWMFPWITRTKRMEAARDILVKKISLDGGKTDHMAALPNTQPRSKKNRTRLLNGNCVRIENNVYFGYRNRIIRMDLCSGYKEAMIIGEASHTTMCRIKAEQLCIVDLDGNIIIWDTKKKQITKAIKNENISLTLLGVPNGHRESYGSSVVYKDEYVWFIPLYVDKVLQLDLKNNMLSEAWFSNDICGNVMQRPDSCGQFSRAHILGDYMYVWNLWNELFFIIDIKSHKVTQRRIEAGISPDEFCSMIWKCMDENDGICHEEKLGTDGLNLFIQSICSEEYARRKTYKNAGKI